MGCSKVERKEEKWFAGTADFRCPKVRREEAQASQGSLWMETKFEGAQEVACAVGRNRDTHTSTIADGPGTTQPAALCATARLLGPLGWIICPSSVQAPSPGLGI